MIRWIGFLILILSLLLFFLVRDGPLRPRSAALRGRLGMAFFGLGGIGFLLLVYGGVIEALGVLAVWCLVAWAYNR